MSTMISKSWLALGAILCEVDLTQFYFFFFFNDTATTEIYTLSLHDALPICLLPTFRGFGRAREHGGNLGAMSRKWWARSEEHTSELQSLRHLVCRLLLEKKKDSVAAAHSAPAW